MNRIDGKICVVTGGSQGLGAAIARLFAKAGAAGGVICARSADKGEAMAASISQETGVKSLFVQADLGKVEDCRAVIAATDDAFGRLDVLVNAAALTDRGGLLDTSPELFDQMMQVNARAPFFLMQDAAKLMIRDGVEGSIVNIGSVSQYGGQPFITPYCASKAALGTLTRNAAFSLLRNRIRVNQLDIGWMASDHEREIQIAESGDPDWEDKARASLPFGRLLDPEEVARAVLFLASDDSGMMTGTTTPMDQSVQGSFAAGVPLPSRALTLDDINEPARL